MVKNSCNDQSTCASLYIDWLCLYTISIDSSCDHFFCLGIIISISNDYSVGGNVMASVGCCVELIMCDNGMVQMDVNDCGQ